MAMRRGVAELAPVAAPERTSNASDQPLMSRRSTETPGTPVSTGDVQVKDEIEWNEFDAADDDEFDEYKDPVLRGLDKNQLRLLYLIARYSHKARNTQEKEKWLRSVPLLVLIFEGIRAEAFDYDYAPQSILVGTKRVYMNISQEGKDDLDDLRESGLVNAVKLSSKEFQSVTAFQLSDAGYEVLDKIPEEIIEEVDDFVMDKATGELVEAVWDDEQFVICIPSDPDGRVSGVTEPEDVSYVSSPYLPSLLRTGGRQTTSNRNRAHEAGEGGHGIQDELEETIVLSEVSILVGEWCPFGSNQVVALNDKLGSTERVQGGLFTAQVDDKPETSGFEINPGLTNVAILDFHLTRHINFEAEINYPEEDGIVQVENFGLHIRVDGTILYGMHIEAILDRIKDNISLDHLARVLVDVQQDSSTILVSLLSTYQRSLLDMIFLGDSLSRDKVNVILASEITPKLMAEQYMDKEDNENEIKQVIGDTDFAKDLTRDQVLVVGKQGMLIAGVGARKHEELIISFLSLKGRDLYVRNFFNRCLILEDTLRHVRKLIVEHEKDPNSISTVRDLLSGASRHVILLEETLGYLRESLEMLADPEVPDDEGGRNLYQALNIPGLLKDLKERARDLKKNVTGAGHELQGLRDMTDVISENQMFKLQEAMQANTKNLEEVFRANERASASLELMQVILAGTLSFDILDRVTGDWTVTDQEWAKSAFVDPLMKQPGVWFLISIGLWILIGVGLIKFMHYLQEQALGVLSIRLKVNLPIDMANFHSYLKRKNIEEEEMESDKTTATKKMSWTETNSKMWGGTTPKIELMIDEKYGFLLKVFIQYEKKKGNLREAAIRQVFYDSLRNENVLLAEVTEIENEGALTVEGIS